MKPTNIYLTILLTAFTLLLIVVADSFNRNSTIQKSQESFVKLSKIAEPSFSVTSQEDRFLWSKKSLNRVYPELPKPSRLEFVYAK